MFASCLLAGMSLSACNEQAEAPKPAKSAAPNSSSMSDMPMAAEMKHGKGVGTVTEIAMPPSEL